MCPFPTGITLVPARWEVGSGGFPILLGGGPIGYVSYISYCISMYRECTL